MGKPTCMVETERGTDKQIGSALFFGVIALIAAFGTGMSAYLSEGGDTLQLLSGVMLSVAIIAGCLLIVAIHLYE